MTGLLGRFLDWLLPKLAVLLTIVLWWMVVVWASDNPSRHRQEAASPSETAQGVATASETSHKASNGSGRVPGAFTGGAIGGGGAFPAAGPSEDPSPAVRSLTSNPVQEAGAEKVGGAVPAAPSADLPDSVTLDLRDFALATPLVGFGGLHPIAESWSRGVASGIASTVGSRFPWWYLALPIGPGFRVRIVGAGGSVERVSTDAGPALHLQRRPFNRVADLSVHDFVAVCGVPVSFGLCQVSVTVMGRS